MKYIQKHPTFLSFIFYLFIPAILIFLSSIFLTFFVFNNNTSFSVIQNFHDEQITLNEQVIKGQITASDNNLGIIAIPFVTHNRTNDKIIFRLKKIGDKQWYYTQSYEPQKFEGYEYFPFGFPVIKDSINKTFYFELESTNEKKAPPTLIRKKSPQIITRYLYSKDYLLKNPSTILPFFFKRTLFTLHNVTNIIMLVSLNIVMLIVYFLIIKVPTTTMKVKKQTVSKKKKNFSFKAFLEDNKNLLLILTFGMLLRIILSLNENYNFDMKNFIINAEIFRLGKTNIYLHQQSYNYSPVLFYLIGFVDTIQRIASAIPFHVLFRIFISSIDIGSALILYKIAQSLKISPLKTVALFFLNPISIILSGFHAQFDNIAVFFLLLSVLIYLKSPILNKSKRTLLWLLVTIGFVTKHIIFPQTFLFYTYLFKNKKFLRASLLFFMSLGIFFASFIPFYSEASETINNNVFKYSGLARLTGFSYIISELCASCKIMSMEIYDVYKYIFLFASLLFASYIAKFHIVRSLLVMTLFFLAFSSSIAAQYFILPLAFGALFPTRWFYLYSGIVTIFLLGNSGELNISAFNLVTVSTAWLFAFLWFVSELLILLKKKNSSAQKLKINEHMMQKYSNKNNLNHK